MHSNRYTFLFAAGISVITAILLAFASQGLKPLQDANLALDTKTSILHAVRLDGLERAAIEKTYTEQVKELVINSAGEEISGVSATSIVLKDELKKPLEARQLPLYEFSDEAGKKYYIMPLRGTGLWGPIWGYISLEGDFNTVHGAYFDHKSETPGLGAEISEKPFQEQFQGKKIMSDDNNFVSVHVVKKAAKFNLGTEHRVDGISGGTITSNGTDHMLKLCIEPYLTYFGKITPPASN